MDAFESNNVISRPPPPPTRPLPYVHTERNRHGTIVYYYRLNRTTPRVRLIGEPGTPEFLASYADARDGKKDRPKSFVYFARAGNKVKIGFAKDPRRRLAAFRAGSSSKVKIYYVTPGGRKEEADLHRLFAEYRVNGEWFLYSQAIRDWIAKDEAARSVS